jgi:CRP/FNR family transcriptional regulator
MQICSLGLSASVGDKLARLFLEWCDRYGDDKSSVHIPMSYTHEEIAEMIGASRETVTRLLKDFKTRNLIAIKRSDLFIPDRKKLESVIGTSHRAA